MLYPISWDVTPITIQHKTKTYSGLSEETSETIYVRMQYGYTKIVTKDSLSIDCDGVFYKKGDLELNKGDKITYDSKVYEIAKKREYRLENGVIEYTKVWFK